MLFAGVYNQSEVMSVWHCAKMIFMHACVLTQSTAGSSPVSGKCWFNMFVMVLHTLGSAARFTGTFSWRNKEANARCGGKWICDFKNFFYYRICCKCRSVWKISPNISCLPASCYAIQQQLGNAKENGWDKLARPNFIQKNIGTCMCAHSHP